VSLKQILRFWYQLNLVIAEKGCMMAACMSPPTCKKPREYCGNRS